MKTPFLGGTYVARSRNLAYSQAINIYPELVDTKAGKGVGAFFGCPGLDLIASAGNKPIKGMISTDTHAYFISGTSLYQLDRSYNLTVIGSLFSTVNAVNRLASIKNVSQVAFTDQTYLYVWNFDTNTFTPSSTLLDPVNGFPVGGKILAYQEGFGIVNQVDTQNFWQSNYNDLTLWSGLAYASAIVQPTNVVSLADLHNEVWLTSEENSSVWINVGSANFVFQQLPGVNPEVGCIAPYSLAKVGDSLMWLGRSAEGSGVVYRTSGYSPLRVSTHALEAEWQTYDLITDAFAYAYQQEGHLFYVLTFPAGDTTWVFDVTTSEQAKMPLWHQRASFSNGAFHRHWGNAYCSFNGLHLIGDYRNGNIYALNLNTYTDAGTPRKWLRTWRAIPEGKQVYDPISFDSLQIDMQTGIDVPANVPTEATSGSAVVTWTPPVTDTITIVSPSDNFIASTTINVHLIGHADSEVHYLRVYFNGDLLWTLDLSPYHLVDIDGFTGPLNVSAYNDCTLHVLRAELEDMLGNVVSTSINGQVCY